MKKSILIVFLFFSFNLSAGGYSQSIPQGYDADTGLFFYPIQHKPESGGMFSSKSDTRIKNILIFDPVTEKKSYLFERDRVWNIKTSIFEAAIKETTEVQFFGRSYRVMNNQTTIFRKIKDKLLIVTSEKDSEILTMWFASKKGEDLKVVHTFHHSVKWHIDIKNSKVRFITHNKEVSFKSIEW